MKIAKAIFVGLSFLGLSVDGRSEIMVHAECQAAHIEVAKFENKSWYWSGGLRFSTLSRNGNVVAEIAFRPEKLPLKFYPMIAKEKWSQTPITKMSAAGKSFEHVDTYAPRGEIPRGVFWNSEPNTTGYITKTQTGGIAAKIYDRIDSPKAVDVSVSYPMEHHINEVFLDVACILQSENYRKVLNGL